MYFHDRAFVFNIYVKLATMSSKLSLQSDRKLQFQRVIWCLGLAFTDELIF